MSPELAVAAAVAGYLAGSISFTRVVGSRVAPGSDLLVTRYPVGADGETLVSRGVSPTAVRMRAGRRWGILAALLDIAKAALPTLALTLLAPGSGAPHIAAGAAVAGHAFPVYHGFRGGFGQSPIIGALLVIDPVALLVAVVGGLLIGHVIGDALVAYEGWPALVLGWAILRDDTALLALAVVANAIYWYRLWPEARQRIDLQRRHPRPWRERVREIWSGYA